MSSADILRLVRQLPPATQAVFNLYVMEGFSNKEIAHMRISEGTSKWHLSEARRILQNLVNRQLKQQAKRNSFVYIDLSKKLSDKSGKLDVKYADPDGLHLNKMGYQAWVKL